MFFLSKNNFRDFLKSKYSMLGLIFLVGFFLRFYNFQQYLFFEIDQARDWKKIKIVMDQGFGSFPLLGPRLGGSSASLGPAYYFFIYLSALIFGDSPGQIVFVEAFLSLMTIPLTFIFFREFFSQKISLGLTALFSTSLFAVVYSRFSWNPNTIPFFVLLSLLSLLRIAREKEGKKKWLWTIILGVGMGIGTQLHSATLFGLPGIAITFALIVRPKINYKKYLAVIAVICFFYLPVFLHEYAFEMKNTKGFFQVANEKSDKQTEYSIAKRGIKHLYELSRNYGLILFSSEVLNPLEQSQRKSLSFVGLVKVNLKTNFKSLVLFSVAVTVLFYSFLRILKEVKNKKLSEKNRNAFILLLIWQVIALFIIFKFTYNPDSRLYLLIIFIPFILLGFWLEKFFEGNQAKRKVLIFVLILFFLINLYQNKRWFGLLNSYQKGSIQQGQEKILEGYYSVTLSDMEKVIDFIIENRNFEDEVIGLDSTPYYIRSVKYLLLYEYQLPVESIKKIRPEGTKSYFFFDKISQREGKTLMDNLKPKYEESFNISKMETFGNLVIFKLEPINFEQSHPLISAEKVFQLETQEEDEEYNWDGFFSVIKKKR